MALVVFCSLSAVENKSLKLFFFFFVFSPFPAAALDCMCAICIISAELSPLSIRERVVHLRITFFRMMGYMTIICNSCHSITDLQNTGLELSRNQHDCIVCFGVFHPCQGVCSDQHQFCTKFQWISNLELMRLFESISSLGDLIFNQHLSGLINIMVYKSSGPVIEKDNFINPSVKYGAFVFIIILQFHMKYFQSCFIQK